MCTEKRPVASVDHRHLSYKIMILMDANDFRSEELRSRPNHFVCQFNLLKPSCFFISTRLNIQKFYTVFALR